MNRKTIIKFTLSISTDGERTGEFPLEEIVENFADLDKEELDVALHNGWKEWAWEYIDGGWEAK